MKYLIIILLMSTSVFPSILYGKDEPLKKELTKSRHDKIYAFEHKLIPALLFKTDGKFFSDLKEGSKSKIIGITEKLVDQTFSKALEIRSIKNKTAYTITFQKPLKPLECYHVLLIKTGDNYSYYTLEKGLDLFNQGNPSVLCQWTKDGTHLNLGTRKYDDLKSFIDDVIKKKNNDYKIQMSPKDEFTIKVPSKWMIKQEEYEREKSATFYIDPINGSDFSLTINFLRKNANLDTPDKLKRVIVKMGNPVLPRVLESSVQVKQFKLQKGYGFYAIFTDKDTAKLSNPGPKDFLYMTRGFIRISDDTILGFMMLTHKTNDDVYKMLGKYLIRYIK